MSFGLLLIIYNSSTYLDFFFSSFLILDSLGTGSTWERADCLVISNFVLIGVLPPREWSTPFLPFSLISLLKHQFNIFQGLLSPLDVPFPLLSRRALRRVTPQVKTHQARWRTHATPLSALTNPRHGLKLFTDSINAKYSFRPFLCPLNISLVPFRLSSSW